MKNPFTKARPIWVNNDEFCEKSNQYAEFFTIFECPDFNSEARLIINCDSEFAVWINGGFALTGQHSQYPDNPVAETLALTGLLEQGENRLAIIGYHQGYTTSTYIKGAPRLTFEIIDGKGSILAASSEETLSRISPSYLSGDVPLVSMQLGFTFCHTLADSGAVSFNDKNYTPAMAVAEGFGPSGLARAYKEDSFRQRAIEKLRIFPPKPSKITAQGLFDYGREYRESYGNTQAYYMQNAALKSKFKGELSANFEGGIMHYNGDTPGITLKTEELGGGNILRRGRGIYTVIDLREETFGYFTIDAEVPLKTVVGVAYSDHLDDLRARSFVGGRNFSATLIMKPGRNRFTHYLSKIGARYIMLYAETDGLTLNYCGIMPVCYPTVPENEGIFTINDGLHTKIYETCVRTLRLCMNEHYMDCPQREQALYAMDSRNQMLAGYYTFGEYNYAKESLRLIAESIRPDGLLELCSPAKVSITIPSFSLYWIIALCEYEKFSPDPEFFKAMLPTANKIMAAVLAKKLPDGTISRFPGSEYWNFHEWVGELAGGIGAEDLPDGDACLTALFIMATDLLAETSLFCCPEDNETVSRCGLMRELAAGMRTAFNRSFYNSSRGAYFSFNRCGILRNCSGLTNALAILCGAAELNPDMLKNSEKALKTAEPAADCSLSTAIFKYDALMKVSKENIDFVMRDIEKIWGSMLYNGATSFWETISGGSDFDDAGSLCHGWSAIPAYIYYRYLLGIFPEKPGFAAGAKPVPVPYNSHIVKGSVRAEGCAGGRIEVETDGKSYEVRM